MKVILSRKGFDSGYGGYPSVILPDGELVTFPIPSLDDKRCYSNLKTSSGKRLIDIMYQLNDHVWLNKLKRELDDNITCHLDPDITFNSVERDNDWLGSFGQVDSAQGHLEKEKIKEGDLFLFFGWFREVEIVNNKNKFKNNEDKHIIFGYLEIGKIIHPKKDEIPNWLKLHPHADYKKYNDNNCIYIAREKCSFNEGIKGYGMFSYNEKLNLTKKGMTRTKWDLPDFFKNLTITYHTADNWKDDHFKSACRGQEFVIEENINIENWAKDLINNFGEKYKNQLKV